MAKILVVDSNPDHQRSLGGLIRHRTPHSVVMAGTCVEGARAAVSEQPDMIMINALMFMQDNYAFPRVLQSNDKTASIYLMVHTAGELEDLTVRRIEVQGVSGVVGLPLSAKELEREIEKALQQADTPHQMSPGVRPVQWARVEVPKQQGKASGPPEKEVRPVEWARVEKPEEAQRSRPVRPANTGASRKGERVSPAASRRPSNGTAGSTFRRQQAPRVDRAEGGFRSFSHEEVDPQNPGVKGNEARPGFEENRWDSVDPKQVKNPRRGRRKD